MRPQHRPVRAPTRAKPDKSKQPTAEPSGFTRNEWLETLSRIKADQPRRYAREVSAGLQVTVSKYEQLRAEHEGRKARVAKEKEANEHTTRTRLQRTRRAAS